MGEQLTGGAEASTADNDDISIEDLLAMGEAFAVSDEVQEKREAEFNNTLAELEQRFGQQQFSYPPYIGTITDIINQCPAVAVLIPQGSDAVANFVSGHEVTDEQAEKLRNPEMVEDVVDDEGAEEASEPQAEEKSIKTERQPNNIDKVLENKNDKVSRAVEETPGEPTHLPDTLAVVNETSIEPEQVPTNDTASGKSTLIREIQPVSQPEKTAIIVESNTNEVNPSQRAVKTSEKVSAETVQVIEKKIEFTPRSPITKVEKVVEAKVAEVAEQKLKVESEAIVDPVQQITDDKVASDVFHIPKAELSEAITMPIMQIADEELILEVETESFIENDIEDERELMDDAIEQTEESIDVESEIVETDERDSEIPERIEAESEIDEKQEPESPSTTLQSVLEREQADDENQPEAEKTTMQIHQKIVAVATELVGEMPVDKNFEYEPVEIQNRIAAVAEHIEVLEHSKNEQECRDAIIGLRKELANLLASLGYQDIDKYVEQIIRNNHDMSELKRIIESLLRAAIVDESITDNVKTANHPRQKFGQWVVQRTTTVLQAA